MHTLAVLPHINCIELNYPVLAERSKTCKPSSVHASVRMRIDVELEPKFQAYYNAVRGPRDGIHCKQLRQESVGLSAIAQTDSAPDICSF